MTRRKIKSALFLAILAGALAAATSAAARANCYKWDPSDSFRCFDCMKVEWTENGWHRVNTCPPRQFPKKQSEPRS